MFLHPPFRVTFASFECWRLNWTLLFSTEASLFRLITLQVPVMIPSTLRFCLGYIGLAAWDLNGPVYFLTTGKGSGKIRITR